MKAGIDYVGISTIFICHDGAGHVLLQKRSTQCRDEHGRWEFGGGQLEQGLSFEENVCKEVQEEYGCDAVIEAQLPTYYLFRDSTHWVFIPFIVSVDRAAVRSNEPHKIEALGWYTLDTLPDPLHTAARYCMDHFIDVLTEKIAQT